MKPGIYTDIPNEEYHGGEGVSSSGLKWFLTNTPAHFYANYLDPERERSEPTPAMKIGTAIHTAILEPDEYAKRYVIIPADLNMRTNAGKATYADLEAVAVEAGADLIKAEDHAKVQRIAASMLAHPQWQRLAEVGVSETSIYWTDEETGVLCKCRPDWMTWNPALKPEPRPDDAIVDVKSAFDASFDPFQRNAHNLGYFVSAGMYLEGLSTATGVPVSTFIWAAVEKEPPFASAFYFPDEAGLDHGRKQYRKALRRYADCLSSGKWPGYAPGLQPMGLPKWFKGDAG
jgi:exodeoxyribonuclease VIII